MNPIAEDILVHYGIKRRSGRYPWGSGEDPHQHGSRDFLGRIEELKKQGWTETPENIKKEFGLTTTQYRVEKSLAKDNRRMLNVAKAKSMAEDGKTPTEIGKEMGVNESTVRSWLNSQSEARMKQAQETANFIRDQIETKGMIDIGTGVEQELRISKEKLKEAITILENEGYPVYKGGIPQVTNQGQQTNQKVICPKGTPHSEIYKFDKIHALNEDQYISRDGGSTFEKKFHYPESMDSKRLTIRYKEDGGIDMDGVVELRRNVPDLSLGENRYSQVRILVDGTHYIKGMAVYADDLPPGVDVRFNTNKTKGTPMTKVLKEIKNDPDNPFGSAIKDADQGGQYWYTDKDGKKKLGLINKRAAEGDWEDWADALPSQFLGKQNKTLIEKQLKLAKADRVAEFDEICSLTNPTIKKHLLNKFADECDSAAVHLKAAALPGQKYHVILPVNTLKETEVYAPRYKDGEKLALVRYPHGGTFEIPILTVNNKNARAIQLMGKEALDAVGINSKVAERLSGADFDGDTVMCIPTHDRKGRVKITSTPVLKDLEGFDPKTEYGPETYKGRDVKLMKNTNTQMGVISNLITDMTLAGATDKEMARAVKHSMVVIDAEKHKLDYKRSEIENGIPALHKKYQGKTTGGAATLLSRAKGEYPVPKRQGTPKLNIKGTKDYDPTRPEGALLYKTADDVEYTVTKTNKRTGAVTTTVKKRTQKSTKMAEYDDAYELVSTFKHKKELVYADYANDMKDLARKARIEAYNTGKVAYSKTAKSTYQQEVNDLDDKLRTAELNKPKERAAQRKANAEVAAKKTAYEKETGQKMKPKDVKKISQQAISKYREEYSSVQRRKRAIDITDREWEAIQNGAISENKLKRILDNADVDSLRKRATPKASTTLSSAKVNRIKAMKNSNYSSSEIAEALGISTATVSKYLKEVN